jgi:hypothetical protein
MCHTISPLTYFTHIDPKLDIEPSMDITLPHALLHCKVYLEHWNVTQPLCIAIASPPHFLLPYVLPHTTSCWVRHLCHFGLSDQSFYRMYMAMQCVCDMAFCSYLILLHMCCSRLLYWLHSSAIGLSLLHCCCQDVLYMVFPLCHIKNFIENFLNFYSIWLSQHHMTLYHVSQVATCPLK